MKPSQVDSFVSRSFILSRFSSSAYPAPTIRAISKQVSSNHLSPSFPEENVNPLSYMKHFCLIIHDIFTNNRNFRLLSDLDSMLSKTHVLDSATSVLVIDGLCQLKKLTRAKTVLLSLKKNGRVSDFFLYSLVLHCLVRDGKISDVEYVWNEICGSKSPVPIDASDFIVYISRFGNRQEVESVCEWVLMGGGVLRKQSYVALIGALCKENVCFSAINVLRVMEEKGFEAHDLTYIALFQCLCRNGHLAEADLVLRNMVRRECSLDVCIYGSFMYGLCMSGRLREAKKLFLRLIEKETSANGDLPRLKMGRRVILQLNCRGKVPEIMAYETYCRSLCSAGKVGEAEILLKEMVQKNMLPEICVYRSFVKALIRIGRSDDAVKFFNAERKKGFVPAEEIAVPVIMGFCELGILDDAKDLLNEIVNHGFVPTASIWNCFLCGYWKQGRVDEAMNLFERMHDGSCGKPDITTFTLMINGFCEHENVQKAISIFQEMIQNNVAVNGTLYSAIIRQLCKQGRVDDAHKYMNEMIENGHLISHVGWKSLFDCMISASKNSLAFGF